MHLPEDQVRRFYNIWMPLLTFVNQKRGLLPERKVWDDDHPIDVNDAKVLRDALWQEDALRTAFVVQNPAGLNDADLAIVKSWQFRVAGTFFIVKHLKKHTIFQGGNRFYAALGLTSSFAELVPIIPYLVDVVLLPFEERIIYDSILVGKNVTFGGNIRRRLNQEYQQARKSGAVITSLLA
jgi:hypothetical protein